MSLFGEHIPIRDMISSNSTDMKMGHKAITWVTFTSCLLLSVSGLVWLLF